MPVGLTRFKRDRQSDERAAEIHGLRPPSEVDGNESAVSRRERCVNGNSRMVVGAGKSGVVEVDGLYFEIVGVRIARRSLCIESDEEIVVNGHRTVLTEETAEYGFDAHRLEVVAPNGRLTPELGVGFVGRRVLGGVSFHFLCRPEDGFGEAVEKFESCEEADELVGNFLAEQDFIGEFVEGTDFAFEDGDGGDGLVAFRALSELNEPLPSDLKLALIVVGDEISLAEVFVDGEPESSSLQSRLDDGHGLALLELGVAVDGGENAGNEGGGGFAENVGETLLNVVLPDNFDKRFGHREKLLS